MARPAKKGLDYFSHDTDASTSREIEYIEATHGLTGYAVYLKILEKIYGHEGYYIPWTEIDAAIFSKRCGVDLATLNAIIATCFEMDLFAKWVFDANQVLTSASIQRRFLEATEKRAKSEINPRFIVSASETPPKRTLAGVSASETPPETEKQGVSASVSTQSKVKESKEENKKQLQEEPLGENGLSLKEMVSLHQRSLAVIQVPPILLKDMREILASHSQQEIEKAYMSAANAGVKNFNYVKAALKGDSQPKGGRKDARSNEEQPSGEAAEYANFWK